MLVAAVFEERYWYPDDGGQVWLAGYTPVDDDGRYLGRDDPALTARGLRIASVAGAARHHAEALESAALGSPLALRRDPGNEHDPNAIQVLAGDAQIGWVPRDLAAELAPRARRRPVRGPRWRCASSALRPAIPAPGSRCCSRPIP